MQLTKTYAEKYWCFYGIDASKTLQKEYILKKERQNNPYLEDDTIPPRDFKTISTIKNQFSEVDSSA